MKVLFIGDVVGRAGRECVAALLPGLRASHDFELVVANGENAAGGFGLTRPTAEELLSAGVDVITLGNHTWAQREIIPYLDSEAPVIRPLNYPPGTPGKGMIVVRGRQGTEIAILSVMGRTFMEPIDSPFRGADAALASVEGKVRIVDVHAEATSEKAALAHYLDGRASAVIGTHTHVPTADARQLPGGTLFLTDVGMVGPRDSVIGADVDSMVQRFVRQIPVRPPKSREVRGPVTFNSVILEIEPSSGRGVSIRRLDLEHEARPGWRRGE